MNRLPLLTLLLIAMAAAGVASSAPDHAHGHMAMTPERTAQAELGASAAFDAAGGLWAVHKVSGHIAVSRSADAGRSWSNPVLVTGRPELTDTGSDARPKIAIGPRGELYVSWTRPLEQPFTGEIKFSRSIDGGRTFSAPVVVHRDRQEITHRFDTLAVTPDGQLFVAWVDKRDLVAAKATGGEYRGAAIYFAVSPDRGATFHGDYKVADHSCECCRIALTAQTDGTVVALWRHIFAPNVRDHALAVLRSDGTSSVAARATFDDWRIDACPHHGPAVAVDGEGRMHTVWFTAAVDKRGIYYGRRQNNDLEAEQLIAAPPGSNADIAAHDRTVVIAWNDFDAGRTRLRATVSKDGGDSWQRMDLLSTTGASDHPKLLCRDGEFHVFWNTAEHPLSVTRVAAGTAHAPSG